MNKERRDTLAAIQTRVEALSALIDPLCAELGSIADAVEAVRDDETAAFDNLPESLQEGERGQQMQTAIDELDSAIDLIAELGDTLGNFGTDDITSHIATAAA